MSQQEESKLTRSESPAPGPHFSEALTLTADNLGRRYGRQWVFRRLSHPFAAGTATAVLGPNGAGKSTLLSILAGQLLPTEGQVGYRLGSQLLPVAEVPRRLAYCAPYLELPEDFTLLELLDFHTRLKPLRPGISTANLLEIMYLERARHQAVRTFSSGMKQRLKLGLALYAATPLLLLDEPTTNLDAAGAAWYQAQVAAARAADPARVVIVSSNVPAEYGFCEAAVRITDFQR